MSTEAQCRANRANAQHSTGPHTEAGLANSSQNRATHRLSGGKFILMRWENSEEFDELRSGLLAKFTPQDSVEQTLVETMLQSQWLARRAIFLQATCFEIEFPSCADEQKLALYLRYQTTHERSFDRALKQLLTLRAQTRKQEIGFESQKRAAAAEARREAAESRRAAAHELRAAADKRKQDFHKSNVLLAQARADYQAILNLNAGSGHPLGSAACQRTIESERALKAA